MVDGVVADLVAFAQDAPHRFLAAGHLLTDLEEGAVGVFGAQHVEEGFGVFARPVVEAEGDDVAVARAVAQLARFAAAAADRAHGPQAEDLRAASRQRLGAAGRRAAAPVLDHPPAVAMRREAGRGRVEREHQLGRAGSLQPRRQRRLFDHPAPSVAQLEADPAVRVPRAADTEQAFAIPPDAAQPEAEVAGASGAARLAVESRQRQRRGAAQAEDQLAPGLRELRPHEVAPAGRAASTTRAGARHDHAQQRRGECERA